MLTDAALKTLKPKEKIYKVADRDGMYVRVKPSGDLVSAGLPDERAARDRHFGQVWAGWPLARSGARAVHRREARDRRGTIARDRETAREAPDQGSEELWRVRREVADGGADGRQHARHAAFDLRERASSRVAQPAADGNHAGRSSGPLRRSSSAARRRRRSTCATSSSRSTASRSCTARRSPILPMMSGRLDRHLRSEGPFALAYRDRVMLKQLERSRLCRRSARDELSLTMVRKSELQDAVWDEVDFENASGRSRRSG